MPPESSAESELRRVAGIMQYDAYTAMREHGPTSDEMKAGIQIVSLSLALLDAIGDTARVWHHDEGAFDLEAVRLVSGKCRVIGARRLRGPHRPIHLTYRMATMIT